MFLREGTSNNVIGGQVPLARNLISRNTFEGVLFEVAGHGNRVQGNYVGSDVSGTKAVANRLGISIQGGRN